MADIYSLSIRADTRDVTRAKQALDGMASGSIRASQATQRLENAIHRTNRNAFRPMQGAVQQAGFQIGDFAVQVGSGQSALVAFSQQASQLAGVFGPGGAVLGAVIAIGGAIAGGLVRSLGEGSEATEDLAKKMRELAQELGVVTERQRDIINTGYAQVIADQTRRIEQQREAIFAANRNAETFFNNQVRAGVPEAVIESSEAWQNLIAPVEEARNEIALAEGVIAATRKEQEAFWKELDKGSESAQKQADQLGSLIDNIQAQADTIGLSARQTALYEAARLGANSADMQAINVAFDQIEAEKQRQEAIKETDRLQKMMDKDLAQLDPAAAEFTRYADQIDRIEEYNISAAEKERLREEAFRQHNERMSQIAQDGSQSIQQSQQQGLQLFTTTQQATLGAIGDIFGNMADIAEKGGKDQFNTWKAIASAQAAVNTALAISNALAVPPPPVGIALASTIGALGLAQIAQIQNTEYQGARQMGGSVSAGGRYLVGESGPEIVTMGGSGVVTPSSVMDGDSKEGDVIVNVNNAPPGTRTESRRDDQGNRFVDVFISDMATGGPMSKSIQSTYGVRRQGR